MMWNKDPRTSRRRVIYEGAAKIIYEGPEPGTVIQYFKDDASAFNNSKKAVIAGKGVLNNRISAHLMTKLETIGIPTHFLKSVNMREQLVRQLDMIPLSVVVRNIAAGPVCQRLGVKEGIILPRPVVEFYYKKAESGDALVNEDHIIAFNWLDPYELDELLAMAWRINDYLNGLFTGVGLRLVDFKLEFGRMHGEFGELYLFLADEISPDNCRLWDAQTGEKLDKDRFRHDLGGVIEAYQDVAKRLGLVPQTGIIDGGNINEQLAASLATIENDLGQERQLRSIPKGPTPGKPRKG
ncbi:phosphoribosylaminoimidazolesuccinocarboxamide synthase [Micavibrio aeruginosavorus]|uniref:phosphoribosylaminoimidazolesuccinocarboxamide synthase n=1 Tax=Micavibrio aeruginosavorus TaxID=349221 RepID=UPI003F4AAE78